MPPERHVAEVTGQTLTFPSAEWFEALADLMNADRARYEHLGYVDCVAAFRIVTGPADREFQVRFEEFSATDVREITPGEGDPDFVLCAELATWREMIENIKAGGGRPDLEHTLNRLSHMGTPLTLLGDDVLRTDLYFRYNQSLQEFFNASHLLDTAFAG